MKTCFKCGKEKERTEFYKHPQMGDGLLGKCKECTKRDSAARLEIKMQDPQFRVKEAMRHRIKSAKREKNNPSKYTEKRAVYLSRHRKKYPLKNKARQAVSNAIRTGKLNRFPCIKCGAINSEAHHEDYSKPLDVIWFCPKHHGERHVEINDQKRMQSNEIQTRL